MTACVYGMFNGQVYFLVISVASGCIAAWGDGMRHMLIIGFSFSLQARDTPVCPQCGHPVLYASLLI